MQNSCDKEGVTCAGFWVRLAAFLADSCIAGAWLLLIRFIMFLGSVLFGLSGQHPLDIKVLFLFTWKDIILYAAGAVYYIIFTYCTGTTPGKRLFNLRVVPAEDPENGKLRLTDVIYRETIGKFLSSVFLYIGYLMAGIDREKRALHDMLCDTRVIYAGRVKVILGRNMPYERDRDQNTASCPDPRFSSETRGQGAEEKQNTTIL